MGARWGCHMRRDTCADHTVCLMPADLINVFEVFLPQLLLYPNPTDPLNGEAAALLMREPAKYNTRVKGEYAAQSAQPAVAPGVYLRHGLLAFCSVPFALLARPPHRY